jgi:hypothetical protein
MFGVNLFQLVTVFQNYFVCVYFQTIIHIYDWSPTHGPQPYLEIVYVQ